MRRVPPSTGPEVGETANPEYWRELHGKFAAIHLEVQEKSKSINKSFGIFNAQTLRHCATNIAQDVAGYKSLIARPYESVNRAMPGSYYSDVERTLYLTYYILQEDVAKYDELFQQERKFISFEYYAAHVRRARPVGHLRLKPALRRPRAGPSAGGPRHRLRRPGVRPSLALGAGRQAPRGQGRAHALPV